jgi:transposase
MMNFKGKQIYLACGATDMRNSIEGLSSAVESRFKLSPMTEAIFVFCNASRNRLKILEWDGDGFWIHYKWLERGKFPWADESGGEKTMTLTQKELDYLLGVGKVKLKFERINYSDRITV